MARKVTTTGSKARDLAGLSSVLPALALLGTFIVSASAAVFETGEFTDVSQAQRYHALINELRCLVCQNQSIADSNADLAADLRREVHRMISSGATDKAIADYLVERYGDFVLYNPPLKPTTVLLWAGPFLLCVIALVVLGSRVARRRQATGLSHEERERAEQLLERHHKED